MRNATNGPTWLLNPVEASKTSLLRTSMHIETLVTLLAAEQPRPVLLGLFQDAEYVQRSRARLERLTAHAQVVVAHRGDPVVEGATHVVLEPDEPLASEWSMIAAGRGLAAALVAAETGTVVHARTIERGRTFLHEATHEPCRVLFHLDRITHALGERMPADAHEAIRAGLGARTPLPGAAAAGVQQLDAELHRQGQASDLLGAGTPSPALTGDTLAGSHAAFHAWVTDAGPRCPALGVVALRVRNDTDAAQPLLQAVREALPAGAVVLAPAGGTLVVVTPGCTGAALDELAEELLTAAMQADANAHGVLGVLDPRVPLLAPFLIGLGRVKNGSLARSTR